MANSSRRRRMRRTQALIVLCGLGLVIVSVLLCIAMTRGAGWVLRIFTEPTLEADSGRKYTPTGAVKRWIEKQDEEQDEKMSNPE